MKKIALCLSLIVSAVLVVGCASQKPPVADNSASAQSVPVKAKDLKGEKI